MVSTPNVIKLLCCMIIIDPLCIHAGVENSNGYYSRYIVYVLYTSHITYALKT